MEAELLVSEILEDIKFNNSDKKYITIEEIQRYLNQIGFYLLIIFFSFPLALPLPYPPGFTTIVGIPLLFFSLQMLIGRKSPWLPKWLGKRRISTQKFSLLIDKAMPYVKKIEKIFRPRMKIIAENNIVEKVVILLSCIFSAYIILPLFIVNHIAGAGILLMFLALLNKDGMMIIVGIVVGVVGSILATLFIIYGIEAVKLILSKIIS